MMTRTCFLAAALAATLSARAYSPFDAEVRFFAAGGGGSMPMQVWTIDMDDAASMRRTLPACAFSRPGYAFAGWKVYDACWDAESGSPYGGGYRGVYAAGASYEACGYLWLEATWRPLGMSARWKKSRTLTGLWGEGCSPDAADGICQLKCGKANRRGYAKVSLKITPFNGRKRNYRPVSVYVGAGGDIVARWGSSYSVTIRDDGSFAGEPIYGNVRPACMPNAVWSAQVGGAVTGRHVLTVDAEWGSADPQRLFARGVYCINTALVGPFRWQAFGAGQSFSAVDRRWDFGRKPMLKYAWTGDRYVLIGRKASRPNLTATRVTYNPRQGLFKGTFVLYTDPVVCANRSKKLTNVLRLTKHKIYVRGAWTPGGGKGVAYCRNPAGSWPVRVK